jgi:hypothetical protein
LLLCCLHYQNRITMKDTKNIIPAGITKANLIENIKFIDGIFNTEDASEILLAVLNDKINFHASLLLSNIERFGVDTSNSEKRIQELRAEKKRLVELIKVAKGSGALLEIASIISIKLIDK